MHPEKVRGKPKNGCDMAFTREEKIILISVLIAAILGILINVFFSYSKKIRITNIEMTNEKIDINTASSEELQKLPGIGNVIAQRILEYRQNSGAFKSADELMHIKGMTAKKYEKIKKFITASQKQENATE